MITGEWRAYGRHLAFSPQAHHSRNGASGAGRKEVACGGLKMAAKCAPLPVGPACGLLATLLPERLPHPGEILLIHLSMWMLREQQRLRSGHRPGVEGLRLL